MCLILVAAGLSPRHALVVAANRDEFHARPASPARFWPARPWLLAGRDEQAGGTWLGVSRDGRFAAVTNVRGMHRADAAESRGTLVVRFLEGDASPSAFARALAADGIVRSGYNFLASNGDELAWQSNCGDGARRLGDGVHAVANELLDGEDAAPHGERFRALAGGAFEPEMLFEALAPARIIHPAYGTRCSTLLTVGGDGEIEFFERLYAPDGSEGETRRYAWTAKSTRRIA